MIWIWDPQKDVENRLKHGLPLSVGEIAVADPYSQTKPDLHKDGDRWDTLGIVGNVLLFVVHTWPDDEKMPGRIISVRKATAHERRAYENHD